MKIAFPFFIAKFKKKNVPPSPVLNEPTFINPEIVSKRGARKSKKYVQKIINY
jgi:hypothetical protein|tara:strand:+ start:512 stop:670 length:159 start_codon:yes stop_codon:yes gene_type:complete